MGYSYYKIGKLEEQGMFLRGNRSTYENLTYKGDENDFFSAGTGRLTGFMPMPNVCVARRL